MNRLLYSFYSLLAQGIYFLWMTAKWKGDEGRRQHNHIWHSSSPVFCFINVYRRADMFDRERTDDEDEFFCFFSVCALSCCQWLYWKGSFFLVISPFPFFCFFFFCMGSFCRRQVQWNSWLTDLPLQSFLFFVDVSTFTDTPHISFRLGAVTLS